MLPAGGLVDAAASTSTLAVLLNSGFAIALFYMLTSVALIYFNKAAFAYYNFSAPNLLTLSQVLTGSLSHRTRAPVSKECGC